MSSRNSADQTQCLHVEEFKKIHIYHPVQTQVKAHQRLNVRPNILDLTEEKLGNIFECIGTGDDFLN